MVQTINIKSTGDYEINFGTMAINSSVDEIPQQLPNSMMDVVAQLATALNEMGGSEVHMEKGSYNTFCHVVKGAAVEGLDFDALITQEQFQSVVDGAVDVEAHQDSLLAEAEVVLEPTVKDKE